jgi:hypothetical protein
MALTVHDLKSVESTANEVSTLHERIVNAGAAARKKKLANLAIDNEGYRVRALGSLKKWVRALELAVEDERTADKRDKSRA